jgi:hypothetical protein
MALLMSLAVTSEIQLSMALTGHAAQKKYSSGSYSRYAGYAEKTLRKRLDDAS